MALSNEVVLRPRFRMELEHSSEEALQAFEAAKNSTAEIVITRVDDHVFLKIPKNKQHYWSPQLDLEIVSFEEGKTFLRGVFGPKPTVWTMFMFLHFAVASLFIGFGIWAYTRASLGEPYAVQLLLMCFMILGWFALYFAGRMGKAKGRPEMYQLYGFMKDVLDLD
ncbi:GTP-binding protein [Aureitalea sp. L0-47]|uniref:GTP-binding protein n=1 Tax=Aureitalea sp. L0-47 TaxID=2816962 RepID=UPI002238747F|nr:GTP-binding protein [Aureitalea sp. L0-47]MCW5520004.1 GTP-binding protein [Aureitalea sp. L0-47]